MGEFWNIAIWEYNFYEPLWLWLLLIVPLVGMEVYHLSGKQNGRLRFSKEGREQRQLSTTSIRYYRWTMRGLQFLGFACLLIPFSRPYHTDYDPPKIDFKNGIDIILAIDASASMLAQDFQPNRLEAAKRVAQRFVSSRSGDRIGLVVYEGEAYTACPATVDYSLLQQQIAAIEPGNLEPGTAVGDGLGVAVTRLRSDSLKSKVIILLTDGTNNAGSIDPLTAARLAKSKSCKVYTVGVGTRGLAPTPIMTPMGVVYENLPVEIDEESLLGIAEITGGAYFRAIDDESLTAIYAQIDKLEKRSIQQAQFGAEPPVTIVPFLLWGLLLLGTAWMIQLKKFKLDD